MFHTRDVIQQMIEGIARAVAQAVGARDRGGGDEALEVLDAAAAELAGGSGLIESMDAASAARILGDGELVLAYARLVAERGRTRASRSEHATAAADLDRSRALVRAAEEMGSPPPPDLVEAAEKLAASLPAG
jgi:hypothetical protein